MGLEDLTGTKYVDDLNENWPLGSDEPASGDDHIRGIKNVLKKTLPHIAGVITLTETELNRGAVPVGAVLSFFLASAPSGWTRVSGITNTKLMRIVMSTSSGGGSAGTDNPISNNKVPAHNHPTPEVTTGYASDNHTHAVAGNTNNESVDHTHYDDHAHTVNNHAHSYSVVTTGGSGVSSGGYGIGSVSGTTGGSAPGTNSKSVQGYGTNTGGQSVNHVHSISLTTSTVSTNHTHTVPVSVTGDNSGENWSPRYVDMIMCVRAALTY
jgi:hypothetical protein